MGYNSIYNSHGCQDGRIYGKTLPHLSKGILKHTGLVDWIYAHEMVAEPDKYLMVQKEIPQFEQIWKAGLLELERMCMRSPLYVWLRLITRFKDYNLYCHFYQKEAADTTEH